MTTRLPPSPPDVERYTRPETASPHRAMSATRRERRRRCRCTRCNPRALAPDILHRLPKPSTLLPPSPMSIQPSFIHSWYSPKECPGHHCSGQKRRYIYGCGKCGAENPIRSTAYFGHARRGTCIDQNRMVLPKCPQRAHQEVPTVSGSISRIFAVCWIFSIIYDT